MANKHLSRPPTEVMKARLKILLENTNDLYNTGTSVLEEDLVSSYELATSQFLESIDGSIVESAAKIMIGQPADPNKYNVLLDAMGTDMEILFAETGALDNLIVGGFNSIISERAEALQASKRVSNKIGDYLLYSDPSLGAGFFFGDSFNSAERIELQSPLLEGDECYLGQEEGVLLLPENGTPDIPKIKNIIINKPSNGNPGNEQELNILGKTEIDAIADSEPDTWYEYEKVSAYESSVPLILDLTLALEEISILNHININPINFGTPTPVQIVTLETSKDGQDYVSIKDEVPLRDFISEDEDDVFSLSPATSSFAGQGFYSFLPRRVQFVHIVLRQDTPYSVQTVNGERLRYAIGLRDINLKGRKFKVEGSIISTPFNSENEIRKVSVWASENPTDASALADVTHAISEDDGATWRSIQPQERDTLNVPEIINYNNIGTGAITTEEPVQTLRHKVTMKRDTEAFQGDVVTKREKIETSELLNVPAGDPRMTVSKTPIAESIRLVSPFFGSFSCPNLQQGPGVIGQSAPMDLDFLEFNVDQAPVDSLRFELPFLNIPNVKEHIRLLVNGEQIELCEKADIKTGRGTSYISGLDKWSKVYFLNKGGRELQFGFTNGDTSTDGNGNVTQDQFGFLPPGGARIQICLDGDNPRLELTDRGYVLSLLAPSDGFKESVSLLSIDALSKDEAVDKSFRLYRGQTKFRIPVDIIGKRTDAVQDIQLNSAGATKQIGKQKQDGVEQGLNQVQDDVIKEAEEGLVAPVINTDFSSFVIEEYKEGKRSTDPLFTTKVQYVNGDSEFYWDTTPGDEGSTYHPEAYSFDTANAILHIGQGLPYDYETIFKYQELKYTTIDPDMWEFYKSSINNRMDTSKIILKPQAVRTQQREFLNTGSPVFNSINLFQPDNDEINIYQTKDHNFYKQRLVKGTVDIDGTLFPDGVLPTEVKFINGYSELSSRVLVSDELVSGTQDGDIWSFDLSQINDVNIMEGSPGFAALRSASNVNTPVNQFPQENMVDINSIEEVALLTEGQWGYFIDSITSLCTVYLNADVIGAHTAEYTYVINDPGIDKSGLYSIDYENGIIYFAEKVTRPGKIKYESSVYSAFYNVANIIPDSDIKSIDEDTKSITISDSLSMRLLKQSSAMKARPAYVRVVYDYYKETTEQMADLEPYFSPICKDIAFRAVTADVLEEL